MFALGGYLLTATLHQGSETVIHRGHRVADGAAIVAKLLRSRMPTALQLAKLRHEYALLRELCDPAIVRVYELVDDAGQLALIMEDLGGLSLSQLLRTRDLAPPAALALALRLARAVAAIHAQGLLHRDLKPHNFIVHPDTLDAKLIDFGIATRLGGGARDSGARPRPDALAGTLAYMSPEQTGRTNLAVDQRSDLYSLGLTLFHLFTRAHPFDTRDPLELVHAQIARVPPPMHELRPDVPPQLSRIVARLVAKDPDARYQTARGLVADLEAFQSAWAATLAGAQFIDLPLARRDRPTRLRRPRRLLACDAQLRAADAAFERVRHGATRMLALSGPAGVGKSAFAEALHDRLAATRCAARCDSLGQRIPYAPIAAALRDLAQQRLAAADDEFSRWSRGLRERLGDDARVLVELVPELAAALGPAPPLRELAPGEARTRFYRALRDLVQSFAAPERPLLLRIDDLQWADAASLELLRQLLDDAELSHVLVVASFRDHEAATGPLSDLLTRLGKRVDRLELSPLGAADTAALVADILASEPDEVAGLAALIYPKTLGNPFFTEQFLQSASERGILVQDPDLGGWRWDADAVAASLSTDNVVELTLARLHRLPPNVLALLQVAACVGHSFELATLTQILGAPLPEVARGLTIALASGLIVPLAGEHRLIHEGLDELADDAPLLHKLAEQGITYRFLHDRVQQAAHDSLADDERQRIHGRIGEHLRPAEPEAQDNARLFALLAHLNYAAPLLHGPTDRLALARLNLLAGTRAREAVAFDAAAAYFVGGLALLGDDAWALDYPLRFNLGLEAILCRSVHGTAPLDAAEFTRLEARAATPLDRARVARVRVQHDIIHGRSADAIAAGLAALALLGVALPADEASCAEQVPGALQRVRDLMRAHTPEGLLELPPLRAPDIAVAVQLLADLSSPVNLSRPHLYSLVIATQVELALRHGHAAIAPYSYMVYAYHLATAHGEFGEAQEIGRFALALLERRPAPEVTCKTRFVYACFAHFACPLPEVIAHLESAREAGLATGDTVFLSFACSHLLLARLDLGESLGELRRVCDDYLALMQRTRVASSIAIQQLARQVIACLQGRTTDTDTLADADFDPPAFLAATERSGLTFAVRWQLLAHLELLVVFGHHEMALRVLGETRERLAGALSFYFTTKLPMLAALTLAANFERTPQGERPELLARIARHQATLVEWAEVCPENYLHMRLLVDAELATLVGDWPAAARTYDEAIARAQAGGFLGHLALAQERCGLFHLRHGLRRVARLYLRDAHQVHQTRGAHAKARQMLERHGDLLRAHRAAEFDADDTWHTAGSTGSSNLQLDLSTAFKAAQALASEVHIERLLAKVVPIAVENSGAERGALLLHEHGALRVAADFGGPLAHPDADRDPTAAPDLPMTVARAVHRTGTPVMLDDAAADATVFRDDPYIRERRVRSLLCAPLVHQGRPLGVLYLENSLTAGVFTGHHIRVIHLLATQAAIAIENANLYTMLSESNRALEQRVAERTAELTHTLAHLRAAQRQLVESEKLAALGTLVAGIAHEINTPVGVGVTAASLLQDRSEEIAAAYAAGTLTRSALERYLADARQSSAMLLGNLNRAGELIQSFKQVAVDQTSEERRVFCLREYIDHVLLSLRPELKRSRHHIAVDGDPDLRIHSFPGAFSQILTNLIMNSLTHAFAPDEAGHLRIAFQHDGERLMLEYGDDGRGIDPTHLGRIFDPFFTTRRDLGGSGLGLHIVYNAVTQRLGGAIRCDSAPGLGARFTIEVALHPPPTASRPVGSDA